MTKIFTPSRRHRLPALRPLASSLGASALGTALAVLLATPAVFAQQPERPRPAAAQSRAPNGNGNGTTAADTGGSIAVELNRAAAPGNGDETSPTWRRPLGDGSMVSLAFEDVGVKDTIPWIAEMTGKVVMPVNLIALQNKKLTLINDEAIPKAEALDLLFQAFRLNGVGVIEKEDVVIIGMIDEIMLIKQMPVIPAEENIMLRPDKGSLVVKLFQLKNVRADEVAEQLGEDLPSHARLWIDSNSNQIVVAGDIGLCQHLHQIIGALDHIYVKAETRTFRLAHADAMEISENIADLFEETGTGAASSGSRNTTRRTGNTRGRPTQSGSSTTPIGAEIELRVTVNAPQNSVTVVGEPEIINRISNLINMEWDLPRSPGTSKIYTLHYTDPIKVAEKLNSLLGQGGSGGGGGSRSASRGGQSASVDTILSGIYRIEPYPDTNQLLVFSKTEQAVDFLDTFINNLDQPTDIGLPFVMELKHANAIELAEEVNVLLAEAGSGATIQRPDEGLSGRPDEGTNGDAGGGSAGTIDFPWQRGGRQGDEQSPETVLIGKVRVVPIVRQNALAVLCPSPQREAVRELISYFDRPGRQVMISAIIAEVELNNELNLGIRLSNSDDVLSGANPDFRLGGVLGVDGTESNPFASLFETSILDFSSSINLAIQALSQKTNVRIIQEPVIFTADNQEAVFFDGQDIPFITNTTINTQGNPTDSFEYREVGVVLNVRPRITVERDVDLEINLELSSIVPGQTLFGGAIVDRRETRTHVIVKNGQTIVLSGILRDEDSKIVRSVPILGDIPLIGELFKSRENSVRTTELIGFITPQVVDDPAENDHNFQKDYRNRLSELVAPVSEQAKARRKGEDKWRERLVPAWRPEGLAEDIDAPLPK